MKKLLYSLSGLSILFLLCLIIIPSIARADLILPLGLGLSPLIAFLLNLLINALIIGLIFKFLIKMGLKEKWVKFLVFVFIATIIGFFADYIVSSFTGMEIAFYTYPFTSGVMFLSIIAGLVMLVLDSMVCKFLIKTTTKNAIITGALIAIITNPIWILAVIGF